MFLCLYEVTLLGTRGRNGSGNVYLGLELGKDSQWTVLEFLGALV